jgi:thioredoxin-like negative regulator of GroEL
MRRAARRAVAAGLAALCAAACQASRTVSAPPPRPDPLASRLVLEQGRALLRDGRSAEAEHVLRQGVADDAKNAALEGALARALEAQGRSEEAAQAWARADALSAPPPPLPDAALPGRGAGTLVAIVPLEPDRAANAAPEWPAPDLEEVLRERLSLRLPEARVLRANPASVAAAGQWLASQRPARVLSLALERSWCGFTVKDGDLSVASLRVAAAAPGDRATAHSVRAATEPRGPGDCRFDALARALELALADAAGPRSRGVDSPPPEWSREALRALFPGIERHLHEALRSGRALLAAGELGEAQRAFASAAAIDPGDEDVQAYLADTELTLALARELGARGGASGSSEQLEPRLPAARREAAERALEEERRRRDELLAALAVLDEDVRPPSESTLAALRAVEIADPDAFGPRLARERAQGEVVARVAYAPDGSELARYYLPKSGGPPVLREEDTGASGAPDRWIAYRGAARSEIFEAPSGDAPALHFVFAEGGDPLQRVEMGSRADGLPERVYRYENGRLVAEERDTDGDGRLDRFDRFDASGRVAQRDEDLDGDGEVDVTSVYEQGRLVRREFSDSRLAPRS